MITSQLGFSVLFNYQTNDWHISIIHVLEFCANLINLISVYNSKFTDRLNNDCKSIGIFSLLLYFPYVDLGLNSSCFWSKFAPDEEALWFAGLFVCIYQLKLAARFIKSRFGWSNSEVYEWFYCALLVHVSKPTHNSSNIPHGDEHWPLTSGQPFLTQWNPNKSTHAPDCDLAFHKTQILLQILMLL